MHNSLRFDGNSMLMLRCLLFVVGSLLSGLTAAATFNLPAGLGTAPFASCSATTFNCGSSISISNNDVINVTSPVTLNITGNFTVGTGVAINVAPGQTLTIIASGNVIIGNNATVNASFRSGGAITVNTGARVNGSPTASGAVSLGNNARVDGNVAGTSIGFGTGVVVNGTCNPSAAQCVGTTGALTLAKSASSTTIPANTNYTFTLTVKNGTASAIAGVVVTDDLVTPGLSYVSCTATLGTCDGTGVWTVGALAAGASATATLIVQSPTAGTVVNTITAPGALWASAVVNVYSPLVDWRMDEPLWNGTVGEVKNAANPSLYNGRAQKAVSGSTSVAPLPYTSSTAPVAYSSGGRSTCGYGVFGGTGGAPANPLGYIELSGLPPLPNSFTFAAWIRSTNPRATGQRILVRDDADNGWGFSLGDGAVGGDVNGRIRFFNRNFNVAGAVSGSPGALNSQCGGGTFCLDTAPVFTANNWFFVALTVDTVAKRISHFVYDASGNLVSTASSAFDPARNWVDGTGAAALGGETAASSEGRGAGFHFQGNIDEVQIYQGVLSTTDLSILQTRSRTCPGSGPDHVELVHDGAGLTCAAEAIRVLGCTSAGSCRSVVADQFVGNVTFTPSTFAGAQWCSDALCTAPLTGAVTVASGTTVYLREPTARTDLLAGTVSGALNATLQCANSATSAAGSTAAACNLTFASAGFLINAPNHTACTPQQITLQAVQASATTTACVPAFANVNRNVTLYSGYTNPTTGTRTASLNYVTSAGGATTSVGALSTNPASPTPLTNLFFDATGTARLTGFTYPDVGQVTLFPVYTGSAPTNDAGLSISAASGGTFVAAPASFAFSAIPAAPLVAGTPFNVTVTAQNACATPAATPNFGRESTAATVSLTSTNPQPALGNAVVVNQTVSGFSGGIASTNVTWGEVGTMDLVATTSNYLGSGLSPSSTRPLVGRFRPAYFDTAVTPACGGFTYSGQPLQRVRVTAKASGGTTTANYAGATWARLVTLTDANSSAGAWVNNTIAASTFVAGIGDNTNAAFTFVTKGTVPTTLKLRASEPAGADGVDSSLGTEGTAALRSGRVRLSNAYGSELLALTVPAVIEFYDSVPSPGWRAGVDTCTVISPTNFAFAFPAAAANNLSACETAVSVAGANPAPLVTLSRPGTGNNGWTDLSLNLGTPATGTQCSAVGGVGLAAVSAGTPWLRFPWTGGVDVNPLARATFGVFKSPLIYRRENY